MKFIRIILLSSALLSFTVMSSQDTTELIDAMVKEAHENSQLERLAHEMLDVIGPRLVGTPQMKQAHDWAVTTFKSWGVDAKNEKWGEWRGWERGITHIDMLEPRVQTLQGMQLAWNPSTGSKGVKA